MLDLYACEVEVHMQPLLLVQNAGRLRNSASLQEVLEGDVQDVPTEDPLREPNGGEQRGGADVRPVRCVQRPQQPLDDERHTLWGASAA